MQKLEKRWPNDFSSFNPFRPTLSLARGTSRQFYCTGVIIYNKLDNYFFVSADRQTFLGLEMTASLRSTSPLVGLIIAYIICKKHNCVHVPFAVSFVLLSCSVLCNFGWIFRSGATAEFHKTVSCH